ncbi:L-ribulose-5-phosphate 4-epimerase AraD [Acidobacteriota bacterium]
MLDNLKSRVTESNQALISSRLVTLTWGNVSGMDKDRGIVAIKPSGVDYKDLEPSNIVLVDLEGNQVEGQLNPSSDTPTHLEIYRSFSEIYGVVHTHSTYATMFAQADLPIPCLGTTHADFFNGAVPVTRWMTEEEVVQDYERNTGRIIVERFAELDPLEIPAVLVAGHGAFTWGRTPEEALTNSIALEAVAQMAWGTLSLKDVQSFPNYLLKKHFNRKHGPRAYYGQKKNGESK